MSSTATHDATKTFDVIVVGAGLAGLCAALEATISGAKVVVVEKSPAVGGGSRTAGGLFAIPDVASATGKADYVDDFLHKSGGRGNRETFQIMADRAIDDLSWLETLGVRLTPQEPVQPYRIYGVFAHPGQAAGMPDLIDGLAQQLTRRGGQILLNTQAQDLVIEGQKVCGVLASDAKGARTRYVGRAVILASGGFSANMDFLEKIVGPNARQLRVRGAKSSTGDGLQLAQKLGAATINLDGLSAIHVAAVSAGDPIYGNPFQALPHCISVDCDGKRFVDESLGYVSHGKATFAQKKGQRAALIFDDALRQNPVVQAAVEVFERLGIGVVAANSIEELAKKIDVPAAALAETIKAFNAAVVGGAAPGATPPKKNFANKIVGPRYYAFSPLVPGVTLSFGGLITSRLGEVVKPDGKAIPGLFAIGELCGGEFFDDYVGGGSLTKCLVMGRIAGRTAAKTA